MIHNQSALARQLGGKKIFGDLRSCRGSRKWRVVNSLNILSNGLLVFPAAKVQCDDGIGLFFLDLPNMSYPDFFDKVPRIILHDIQCGMLVPYGIQRLLVSAAFYAAEKL